MRENTLLTKSELCRKGITPSFKVLCIPSLSKLHRSGLALRWWRQQQVAWIAASKPLYTLPKLGHKKSRDQQGGDIQQNTKSH